MNAKGLLCAVLALGLLGAPAKADPIFDVSSGLGAEAADDEFLDTLYSGYAALSEQRTWATDLLDGEHFNHKARTAARRSLVGPDELMDRALLEEDMAELAAALSRLRLAFDRGARTQAPVESGNAQVAVDCWIEAAEGANPGVGLASLSEGRRADAEKCRAEFEKAIEAVEAAATFRLTEVAPPSPAPQMTAAPQPMAAPKPFIVHFAWDSDVISAAGMSVIEQAVAMADELGIVDFSVTGHADRSGAEDYNLGLSLRRANNVRDALIARGVKATGISVAGRGEAEPAVPTADGVRESANRRVEIIFL